MKEASSGLWWQCRRWAPRAPPHFLAECYKNILKMRFSQTLEMLSCLWFACFYACSQKIIVFQRKLRNFAKKIMFALTFFHFLLYIDNYFPHCLSSFLYKTFILHYIVFGNIKGIWILSFIKRNVQNGLRFNTKR